MGTQPIGAVEGSGRWFWLAVLLAGAIVTAAYANHFDNGFHFDDSHVIENNGYIRSLTNVPRFFVDATTFSSLPDNQLYRPLLTLTYAIDYWRAGDLEPRAFHVTQFLLHLSVALAVVWMALSLFRVATGQDWRWAALGAGTLFALHTANTETVNYLSSRSDVISTLGIMLALLMYIRLPGWRRYYVYLVPMLIGVLAKSPAVMFAPILVTYVWLFEPFAAGQEDDRVWTWRRIGWAVRQGLPALVAGLGLLVFVEAMNPPTVTYGGGSRLEYLLTQPFVWLHYVRLFVVPIGLTADTDWRPVAAWYDTRVAAGVLAIGLGAYLFWRCSRLAAWRPVAFGLSWCAIGLVPSSSIVPLAEVANEHRIYLPYVGLSLAAAWAVMLATRVRAARWPHAGALARTAIPGIVMLVLVAHAFGTSHRNTIWRTEESLWADVVEKSPGNGRGWMNYGLSQMAAGNYTEARRLFDEAKRLWPNYPYIDVNLGILHGSLGDTAAADASFRRALQLSPEFASGMYYYGRWLTGQERAAEALPLLRRSVQLSPGFPPARELLMHLAFVSGADAELDALVRETQTLVPGNPAALAYAAGRVSLNLEGTDAQAFYDHGLTLTTQQNHLDAAIAYRQAVMLAPEFSAAHHNLGWELGQLGLYGSAMQAFETALELSPGDQRTISNLAWVRSRVIAQSSPAPATPDTFR